MKNGIEDNTIVRLTLEFAVEIVRFCDKLETEKRYVIARQLLKSGTSIGANVRESQNAESRADFIHKLKISAKEAEETDYWLLICTEIKQYPELALLADKLVQIRKILHKIIFTSKARRIT